MNEEPIIAQTRKETDKKCPSCGATADYDPTTGMLLCPYCGTKQQIKAEDDTATEELDFESAELTGNFDWGAETRTVLCKNCGASTVYDSMTISGECPYCGSNQVIEQESEKTLVPGGVCPFRVDLDQAGSNFKSWIGKKLFCPSVAKRNAKPDAFNGIYLPYWTFDSQTTSDYTARYGKDRRVKKGDSYETVTDWYKTNGVYQEFIDDELVIATSQQNSDILRRVEPFNTEDNVTYKPEYLAGFGSERYSIGLKDAWERAKNSITGKLRSHITSKIKDDEHADRVDDLKLSVDFAAITYKYLLLPLWISSFEYNGKIYQFMVNGQTGKVGGKAPVSPLLVIVACLIGAAVCAGIYFLSTMLK